MYLLLSQNQGTINLERICTYFQFLLSLYKWNDLLICTFFIFCMNLQMGKRRLFLSQKKLSSHKRRRVGRALVKTTEAVDSIEHIQSADESGSSTEAYSDSETDAPVNETSSS